MSEPRTKGEVGAAFRAELDAFLRKWDAEIEVYADDGVGYMEAWVNGKWTSDGEVIREDTFLNLGGWLRPGPSES